MKLLKIFPLLIVAVVALESPERFLRGSEEGRELRAKNALFTTSSCQSELSTCQKSLSNTESWQAVLSGSGIESLEGVSTTNYQSIVTGFSKLTTRQRAANAAKTIPQIVALINGLQNNGSSADQVGTLTTILAIAETISQFIFSVTGVDLSIITTIVAVVLDLATSISTGNPITIIRAIISTITTFFRGFSRNLRTVNLFASADNACMAELMSCSEADFLNKVAPQLIALSKL